MNYAKVSEKLNNLFVTARLPERYANHANACLSGFLLLLIFLFAMFLRLEDFPDWSENKTLFSYQNEYQMANFDSYYYLQFAKDIKRDTYDEVDEKRRYPNGASRPSIPPLLSTLAVYISQITNKPLATVAIFIPAILSPLLALVMFFLSRRFGLNRVAALTASLFSIISISYIVRTRVGVFDTDSLNVVFSLFIAYLFLRFALDTQKRYLFLALGFISTFLYFIWWDNAISVTLLSAFVPLSIAILFFDKVKNTSVKYSILGLIALFVLYFLSEQIFSYMQLLSGQGNDIFALNSSVQELEAVSMGNFIDRTTNNAFVFLLMFIGLIYFIWQQRMRALLIIIPIILGFIPFVAGNRFVIFSAPILALGMGYFVQLLFNKYNTYKIAHIATLGIIALGIYSIYPTITYKLIKPAVWENRQLLDQLKTHTPVDAAIWTNWSLGHQIHYYLDRSTFADGQFSDGELFYYLSFPLAANNLALSANFMRFYSQNGVKGMQRLYQATGSKVKAFEFLQQVLARKPDKAKKIIAKKLANNTIKTDNLTTVEQWLDFLYPQQTQAIYLFLHQRMLKTVSWFKQGSVDLKTGEMVGLPFFLGFDKLKGSFSEIKNKDITVDKRKGTIDAYSNGVKHSLSHIFIYDNGRPQMLRFPGRRDPTKKNFVFEWNKTLDYGAAMSKEMSNTSFNKLFMRHKKSDYFKPVSPLTAQHQIWQVIGDVR
ncbi:MAG: hypothetical protein HFP81_00305 [Methylococcales symbiont of Hymedesmia sp. n. MRB-2018]|nr:MAG: hypothetical protein HFP81_00305 [Methylococcales symbiont of Hymedesmia sp. n. MRB-2018]